MARNEIERIGTRVHPGDRRTSSEVGIRFGAIADEECGVGEVDGTVVLD
jgi:hypothetical protein